MTAKELVRILRSLPPGADQVSVKGRREPLISASVPETSRLVKGWTLQVEAEVYRRPGFIRWTYHQQESSNASRL